MKTTNSLKALVISLTLIAAVIPALGQSTGPTYSDSWTAAPGFVPQMPYATISENESVNIYNGNLTVIYPIGPAIPVGPELSFQAKLRYVGVGSGGVLKAYGNDSLDFEKSPVDAGQWTTSYGVISLQPVLTPPTGGGSNICVDAVVTYTDENGTAHTLFKTTDTASQSYFSIDGSNIHAVFTPGNGGTWTLYFPGGIYQLMDHAVEKEDHLSIPCPCPGEGYYNWHTTKVYDRFNNGYKIDYDSNMPALIDKVYDVRDAGRVIDYSYSQSAVDGRYYMSSITVPKIGGDPAVYDLTQTFETGYNNSQVAMLTQIAFPPTSGSTRLKMLFEYYDYYHCSGNNTEEQIDSCDKSFALQKITYPTGGWTEYDYEHYTYFLFVGAQALTTNDDPGEHTFKLNETTGFGVNRVKRNDGNNTTIRILDRVNRNDPNEDPDFEQDAPFASIQETLPDGQKILHICELRHDIFADSPNVNSLRKGNEVVTLFYNHGADWTDVMRWAYEIYGKKAIGGCTYDGTQYNPNAKPERIVENKWKRMLFQDQFRDPNSGDLETECWKVTKSTTKDYSDDGKVLIKRQENYYWDGYGHFLLTREYGTQIPANSTSEDPIDVNKITIRQYIPPKDPRIEAAHGTRNLRNREEFEATFNTNMFSIPANMMPPQGCEDCEPDPQEGFSIPQNSIIGPVTAGISQFYTITNPEMHPEDSKLNSTGNAKKRIALSNSHGPFALHVTDIGQNLYWAHWGVDTTSVTDTDWVETREFNETVPPPLPPLSDDYPGTISKIHLSYGPNYPSGSQGVEYKYSYGVVKSKQFLGIGYKEAERDIDKYTGLIKSEWDANNIGAGYSYDNLLRLTKITPTHSEASEYIYYPPYDAKKIEYGRGYDPSTNMQSPSNIQEGATHKVFEFDGLGRLIKSKELMPDDTYSVVEKAYDPNGREFFVSEPYTESTPNSTDFSHESLQYSNLSYYNSLPKKDGQTCFYGTFSTIFPLGSCNAPFTGTPDPLGRVMRVIKPDSSHTDTSYDGYTYAVTLNGINGPGSTSVNSSIVYTNDAFGRLVFVDAPNNNNTNSADAEYFYDSQDRLIKVDLGGQIRKFEYDPLGFLRKTDNPENGIVTIDEYDVWGNILKYQDANGQAGNYKIKNTYDAKGRITVKEKVDASGNFLARLNEWIYDGA
ncbi:MAG TPA: hypothetical protein PKJ37_10810, partial [Acidobacteriota bacterium]|nr:hypothetical protein [Acidobacteriota bacterium]HNT18366.1 hypothetical protein [Acidobacteriota bacterium]